MTIMAAACGILIVILGLLSTLFSSKAPTDGEFAIQVMCLIGGLILCFLAVVLSRLGLLMKRLDEFEAEASAPEASAYADHDGASKHGIV